MKSKSNNPREPFEMYVCLKEKSIILHSNALSMLCSCQSGKLEAEVGTVIPQ